MLRLKHERMEAGRGTRCKSWWKEMLGVKRKEPQKQHKTILVMFTRHTVRLKHQMKAAKKSVALIFIS